MPLRTLVVVGLRLAVIYSVLQMIVVGLLLFQQMVGWWPQTPTGGPTGRLPDFTLVLLFLFGALSVGILGLVWFGAGWIARRVVDGEPPEIALGGVTLGDLYSVGFIGLGLAGLLQTLPRAATFVLALLSQASARPGVGLVDGADLRVLGDTILPILASAVLFLKGRGWAVALARRHKGEPGSPGDAG